MTGAGGDPPLPWDGHDAPALLTLDRIGDDLFRNRFNDPNINGALFGGQVLGQALAAAYATVADRAVHSLHAYFLRPGSVGGRVLYQVERSREGNRFSTRRVVARQGDTQIFEMSCSFFVAQRGFEHQFPAGRAPPPESLDNLRTIAARAGKDAPRVFATLAALHPIEVRPVEQDRVLAPIGVPRLQYWVRVPSAVGTDDPKMHQQILAYLSDFWLIAVALAPHHSQVTGDDLFIASLDHAMWFHRPVRADEWLLFETDSPSARNGVNLARGLIYDRAGALVASIAQEALQVPRR